MLKRFSLACLVAVLGSLPLFAQDILTLTAPITTANATNVRLERITVDLLAQSVTVQWRVRDSGGNSLIAGSAAYPTPAPVGSSQPTGATIMRTINTGNFSVNSLSKRLLQQLQTDGYLAAGSISGTPE